MFDSIIIHGVTRAGYHSQFHLWPYAMQVIRCDHGTHIIQSALHSYARDPPDLVDALQSKKSLNNGGLSSATYAATITC